MVTQRVRDYEMVLVLSPEATEQEVAGTLERLSRFIAEHGGAVSEQVNWGIRRLAYPIKRFQEGNYFLARFSLDAKDVIEFDRTLNLAEDVLRHLVIKLSK